MAEIVSFPLALAFVTGWASIDDIRHLRFAYITAVVLTLLGLHYHHIYISEYSVIAISILILLYLFILKQYMGFGDILFIIIAISLMPVDRIGLFFLISGLAGLPFAFFYRLRFKTPIFPLVPALAIGLNIAVGGL